MLLPIIDHM